LALTLYLESLIKSSFSQNFFGIIINLDFFYSAQGQREFFSSFSIPFFNCARAYFYVLGSLNGGVPWTKKRGKTHVSNEEATFQHIK